MISLRHALCYVNSTQRRGHFSFFRQTRLSSGQFELQTNDLELCGWLLNGKVEWLHLMVMVLSVI